MVAGCADGTGDSIDALAASTPPLVNLDDIEAARRLLTAVIRHTPVESSEHLSALAERPILLKAEYLQRTGSFKVRGAYNRIARLDPAERASGVVAASAGNHAQGVALSASLLGVKSTIFMPATAPFPKLAAKAISFSASSRVAASGFSMRQDTPRSRNGFAVSKCVGVGVAITTASVCPRS